MKKRNVLHSPRLSELKRKRRRVLGNKILLVSASVFLALAALSYISRIPKLNIYAMEISGNSVVDTEAIRETAESAMASKYLWLFPKTNIFIYPKDDIKKILSDKFKRLKDIELSLKQGRTLQISMAERKALYTWCGASPDAIPSDASCYFMDEVGYIFDQAPYFSGEVYFKFYGPSDAPEGSVVPGSYYLKKSFQQIVSLKSSIEVMGLRPVAAYALEGSDAKIFLSPSAQEVKSPEIIFNLGIGWEKMAENLQAALDTEPLKSNIKNKYSSLEYLDLRFGNKVYFKFRQ